jgi:hypothetical protein
VLPTSAPRAGRVLPAAAPLAGRGVVSARAEALLHDLGVTLRRIDGPADPHPALLWADSGAMALTGHAAGPPRLARGPLAASAHAALRALRALAPGAALPPDGGALLGERAACTGATRAGRITAGGQGRLLRTADAWIALQLARPDDVALLPAWLEAPPEPDAWAFVGRHVAHRRSAELARRAAWLGLPMAVAAAPPVDPPRWVALARCGAPLPRAAQDRPFVVDLSSLWAGPLCTALLQATGAHVAKVESPRRPDGARLGSARFFDLQNAGKASVALDFTRDDTALAALRRLLGHADVVVESARPRALRQAGLDAEAWLAERPGRVWLSISGYGRDEPEPGRVAFGDDAAVAAGLAWPADGDDGPVFCGDAIADPLTGLHAALAALAVWRAGGGQRVDLALRDVAAFAASGDDAARGVEVEARGDGHVVRAGGGEAPVRAPRARATRGRAAPLGADTRRVLEAQRVRC